MNMDFPVSLTIANDKTKLAKVFEMMCDDNEIKGYYENRLNRIIMSAYSFIINSKDLDVGIINLIREDESNPFLFLDIGVIKEYRNKGVATDMLKFLSTIPIKDYIIVKSNHNVHIERIVGSIGLKIYEYNGDKIYLLQKKRYDEFMQTEQLEKLARHFNPSEYLKFELERMSKGKQKNKDYMGKIPRCSLFYIIKGDNI